MCLKNVFFVFFESTLEHSPFKNQICVLFVENIQSEYRFLVVKAKFSFLENTKSRCYCVPKIRKSATKTKKTFKTYFFVRFWQTSKDEWCSKKWKLWNLYHFGSLPDSQIINFDFRTPFTNLEYTLGGPWSFPYNNFLIENMKKHYFRLDEMGIHMKSFLNKKTDKSSFRLDETWGTQTNVYPLCTPPPHPSGNYYFFN